MSPELLKIGERQKQKITFQSWCQYIKEDKTKQDVDPNWIKKAKRKNYMICINIYFGEQGKSLELYGPK
jgi:hypothetical protein